MVFSFFFFNTYLSKVAANMYLPFGENFTKDTGGLSSSTAKLKAVLQSAQLCCLPEKISFHIHLFLTELFLFHWNTKYLCEKQSPDKKYFCLPISVFKHWPDAVSQIRLLKAHKNNHYWVWSLCYNFNITNKRVFFLKKSIFRMQKVWRVMQTRNNHLPESIIATWHYQGSITIKMHL